METNYIGNVELNTEQIFIDQEVPLTTSNYQFSFFNVNTTALQPGFTVCYAGMDYQEALTLANTTTGRNTYSYNYNDRGFGDYTETEYQWIWKVYEANAPSRKFPPPPPDDDDPMKCCPQNTQLLRLILKKIGSDNLPASVPQWLTVPSSPNIQIDNLAQFIAYTVRQIDAVSGKYPIDVEIEDIDLTQEGNQTQLLKIPNIAEALGEILSLLLLLRAESDANLSATIRGMIEAGSAKQAATLAVDYGAANAEFLGYKGKQVSRDLPMAFDPSKEQLDQILKETTIKFKGWDNEDKNDINDLIAPILEMAAMWKAQNFRKTGADDPSGKIRGLLRNSAFFAKAIDDFVGNPPTPTNHPPDQPPPPKPKDEWDSFLEDAESGFISQPGITDPLNPYGREFNRRPRIREIGTDTTEQP